MKIVHVDNYTYFGTLFGSGLGLISTIALLSSGLFFEAIFSSLFTVVIFYYFQQAKKYRVELSKGLIKEITQTKSSEVQFSTISQLDCKEIESGDSRNLHAVFTLETQSGIVTFETSLQASLLDIALWVRDNYPSAQFTGRLNTYLTAPHSKKFF